MKKKEYIKPELKVFKMETQAILAGSYIEMAKEEDYSDENIDKHYCPRNSFNISKSNKLIVTHQN